MEIAMLTGTMDRYSVFSYHCDSCGACCRNKRIQVNPYEILRLARNRGLSSGEFIYRYLKERGPYLRNDALGRCVFLAGRTCTVHNDRPLACRTYPLGRWVSGEWEETFRQLDPHPQCRGKWGEVGTVGDFLRQEGAQPYIDAADRYQALFYRLFSVLGSLSNEGPAVLDKAREAMFSKTASVLSGPMQWLDVDLTVERYCKERSVVVPVDIEGIIKLHVEAVDSSLRDYRGGRDE